MNTADAAKRQKISHFVWSTLEGNTGVPHFDSKALISDHLKAIGVPTTYLYTSFYWQNMQMFGMMKKQDDGNYVISMDMDANKQLPGYSVADTGAWVAWALDNPKESIGKDLKVCSEFITPQQMADQAAKLSGKKFVYNRLPPKSGGEEMYLNFKYFEEHPESSKIRDVAWTIKTYPQAQKWADAVKEMKL